MASERDNSLAGTKLRPPTLPDRLVQRSRLDDLLHAGTGPQVRLLLVSAPAGSGKSTLLASWLKGRPEAGAWLQLERGDSDPARFWLHFVEALGQAQPELAETLRQTVVGSNGDEFVVIPALVNKLSEIREPFIVVIDDYHLIDNKAVHEGMERLIELCPDQVTIVCSTRIDPPFRLGRLRVRNHLSEIRGDDLRFESDEASGLLGSAGDSLDSGLLNLLWERTEGWAAGLVLAGISLSRSANQVEFVQAFHGNDALVVDYLSEELLGNVSAERRNRLLETSILEQFNGSLVDAVTAKKGGNAWLRDTVTVNQLVIGLDSTGEWFRYHHLLRDLLRLEADRTFPDELPALHERAAGWFEQQGDLGQAIVHQFAAGNTSEVARLMFVYGPNLLLDGQVETLRQILEQLGEVARTVGWCALLWGWVEFIAGRYSRAEEWLDAVRESASDGYDEAIVAPLQINIALSRGNVASALTIAQKVTMESQREGHQSAVANAIGMSYTWAGQTAKAKRALDTTIEKATEERSSAPQVLARIYLAITLFDDGQTANARVAAIDALDTAKALGMASYYRLAPAYAIQARTANEPGRSLEDVKLAIELARRAPGDLAFGYVLTICADTLTDLGDSTGKGLLVEARSVIDRCPDPGIAGRHLDRIEARHGVVLLSGTQTQVLIEQLTEREVAVLRYLPTSLSQREISSELFVSFNTVKTHCSAIYRKLGVGGRKAAVQAARDLDLL